MDYQNRYQGIDKYAVRLVRKKAKQLIGEAGFTEADRHDLEQEMILDLLIRLPKYDPDRAQRNTLIAHIVNHRVVTIIESRGAGKRDYRLCTRSLNDFIDDGQGNKTEYLEIVDPDKYLQRIGKHSRPLEELNDLSIDVWRIIENLPPGFRDLCNRLQKETVSEISRATGIPRGTIYESIKKLQEILQDAGLKNYL